MKTRTRTRTADAASVDPPAQANKKIKTAATNEQPAPARGRGRPKKQQTGRAESDTTESTASNNNAETTKPIKSRNKKANTATSSAIVSDDSWPPFADYTNDSMILERISREQQPLLFFVVFPRVAIILKRRAHEARERLQQNMGLKKKINRGKDEVVVNKKRLEARLKPLRLEQAQMQNDGNCQFRAFSHQLFGSEKHHQQIRKACVEYILKQRDSFMVFFDGNDDFMRYIESQKRDRTWGDEITLKAMCDTFGVNVHVITSTEHNWHLEYTPDNPSDLHITKKVFISYISPVHYNSLVLKIDAHRGEGRSKTKSSISFEVD